MAEMFARLPLAVIRRRDISDTAKLAWARLRLYAGAKGACSVSHAHLAEECGSSRRSIQRAVDELLRVGLVDVRRSRYAMEYTFPDAPNMDISDPLQMRQNRTSEMRQNGASEMAQMRQLDAPDASEMDISPYIPRCIKDVSCASPQNEAREKVTDPSNSEDGFALTSETSKTEPLKARQERWFLTFWEAFWRKEGKKDAFKAFVTHVRTEAELSALMDGLEKRRAEMESRELRFRKTPGPWIRSEVWREPVEPQPVQSSDPWDSIRPSRALPKEDA